MKTKTWILRLPCIVAISSWGSSAVGHVLYGAEEVAEEVSIEQQPVVLVWRHADGLSGQGLLGILRRHFTLDIVLATTSSRPWPNISAPFR